MPNALALLADDPEGLRDWKPSPAWHGLIGDSAAMRRLRDEVVEVARTEIATLIRGETGTGKDLVARAIHREGQRRDGPLVTVICPALPREPASWPRLLAEAAGGSLFLDQVGDMPDAAQAAFLSAHRARRVGPAADVADVRLLSSSTVRLEGLLHPDLLALLGAARVNLPPLRDRREDLPALILAFLARTREPGPARGLARRRFAKDALDALAAHPWPGNVRELHNVLERILVTTTAETIEAAAVGVALFAGARVGVSAR